MDWTSGSRLGTGPGFDILRHGHLSVWGWDASEQDRNGNAAPPSRSGGVVELWSWCAVWDPNFQDEGIRGTSPVGGGDNYSSVPK